MKVFIINQPPLDVTREEAKKIVESIAAGADFITIHGEYITASAIAGVRSDDSQETIPASLWGLLPAGRMKHFFDDRRENPGEGRKRYEDAKKRIFSKPHN